MTTKPQSLSSKLIMPQCLKTTSIAIVSYDFIESSKNSRPLMVYKTFKDWESSPHVTVYCANFSHHKKKFVDFNHRDFQAISVPPYRQNISLRRIISYWIFCLKVVFQSDLKKFDLIYFCVPPNELSFVALIYKVLFRKKIVLDVVDLWPEAFPLPQLINPWVKNFFRFTFNPLRNILFRQADLIICQSAYFKEKLFLPPQKCRVVLMGTTHFIDTSFNNIHRGSLEDCIYLLYLGSINAINDLDSLVRIIAKLKTRRKVHLSVIGGGKRLPYLQQQVDNLEISCNFYGVCFDPQIKHQEFMRCHFGYNGYVASTEVAISYRSLEFLSHGLPLLNSTKGDTEELIKTTNCGFNFQLQYLDSLVEKVLALKDEDYYSMQQRSMKAFQDNFSWSVFQESLSNVLKDQWKDS
jgi:glycosyltransferase involved in cell wall biosynthesis